MANLVGEDVLAFPTTLRCRRCGGPVAPGEFYRRRTYRGPLWRLANGTRLTGAAAAWVEVEHLRCPGPAGPAGGAGRDGGAKPDGGGAAAG